jgi:hypothetical protein
VAIHTGQLTATTTAQQIDGNFTGWSHIHIRNNDNTKSVYIGNSDVSGSNGLQLDGNSWVDFDLPPGDAINIVTSSGSSLISWLRIDN